MKRIVHRSSVVLGGFETCERFVGWVIFCCALSFSGSADTFPSNQNSNLPPALMGKPLRVLSSGALMLLNQSNNLVWPSLVVRRPKISSDANLIAGLDAR